MTQEHKIPDAARSRLRTAAAAVERAMSSHVATEEDRAPGGLLSAWRELVDLLALGPEPEYRTCPACGGIGMHDAKVCGYCWAKLSPPQVQPH